MQANDRPYTAPYVSPPQAPPFHPIWAVYAVYALAVFFLLLLVVSVCVCFCMSIPSGKREDRVMWLCKAWAAIWFGAVGIRYRSIHISKPDPRQRYVFLANHISYLDIPVALLSIHQGYRILGKKELTSVPLFGWIYAHAVVPVERETLAGRAASAKAMLKELEGGRSMFVFPEGTFNEGATPMKDFYDGAFRIAAKTGTPVFPIVFPDTAARLHFSSFFALRPGECRAVFLPAIYPNGRTVADAEDLKKRTFKEMEAVLINYGRLAWGNAKGQ